MGLRQYDIVVVGAGPAGLSAARTAARLGFRTLLVERQTEPAIQAGPSSAVIAPVPGYISALRREDGSLHFPALDLSLGPELVLGYPSAQRFVSPAGHTFLTTFAQRDDFPVAAIDMAGMLRQMLAQAEAAGADIWYDTNAAGLWRERGRIRGIVIQDGTPIRAELVLAGEGVARKLADEAGVYASGAHQVASMASVEMDAPSAGPDDVGQIVTLGQRYTSANHAVGTVMVPKMGRLLAYFTVVDAGPVNASQYLDEYLAKDPRIRSLVNRAREVSRSEVNYELRDRPVHVVRDGFMAVGDAVAPGGHLGVVPAVYLGRQAALVAAEAVDGGDASASCLATYQQLLQGPILNALEAESRTMQALVGMPDEQLDALCEALGHVSVGRPPFGSWRAVAWDTMGWLVRQLPLIVQEWDVLHEALSGWEDLDRSSAHPFGVALTPVELPGLRTDV